MRAPAFWRRDGVLPRLLSPLSSVVAGATALRMRRAGWHCPIPVICVGNATVGGAGKTTVALDLTRRLTARGWAVHVLLRGYGGRARGLRWVEPGDSAEEVGDEALLHAAVAPTWTCADRGRGARAAVSAGAEVLVLDDGLQNPGVRKRYSVLVIDGATGFGNGRVFPAGPLREPIAAAMARCQAAVLIGADEVGALRHLPAGMPVLRAHLVAESDAAALRGRRVLAFAGIAMPDKFFSSLLATGAEIVGRMAFPDHHMFRPGELADILAQAEALRAQPVTTAKDAVRLPHDIRARVSVLRIGIGWEDATATERMLGGIIDGWAAEGRYRRSYRHSVPGDDDPCGMTGC